MNLGSVAWQNQFARGKLWAISISVIAHATLFALIFFQFKWNNNEPEEKMQPISVELWRNEESEINIVQNNQNVNVVEAKTSDQSDQAELNLKENNLKEHSTEQFTKSIIHKEADLTISTPIKKDKEIIEDKSSNKTQPQKSISEDKSVNIKANTPDLASVDNELKSLQQIKKEEVKEREKLANEKMNFASSEEKIQRSVNMADGELQQLAGYKDRENKDYISKIQAKVRGNIARPLPSFDGNPEVVFQFQILPSGEVLAPIKLIKSSGNDLLDQVVERGILKSSPFPKPINASQRQIELKYRPLDE